MFSIDQIVNTFKNVTLIWSVLGNGTVDVGVKEEVLLSSTIGPLTGAAVGKCPAGINYAKAPASGCTKPTDPNNLPESELEQWFTKEMFADLFPKANLGYGPHECFPFSYESFAIASRYFPEFGNNDVNNIYTDEQNNKRDISAFFAHAVQETGENDADLYLKYEKEFADDCFYRGGFFNWFEGGPVSSFLRQNASGSSPEDGSVCNQAGKYCTDTAELSYFYPCNNSQTEDSFYKGCYFGRGAIQISYNYNYGMFQDWLKTVNISVDLLNNPNLVMTHMSPPLAIMASIWFYMTPQPPKPAMHDIVVGKWNAGESNVLAGYSGPIFGPTSLIINNECGGEDVSNPGGPGESRRIKAFKWFGKYFDVEVGPEETLSCKNMKQPFDRMFYPLSWQPSWSQTWKEEPCECLPATYGGIIPYFDPAYYPPEFQTLNDANQLKCVNTIYDNPAMYNMNPKTSACLNHPNKYKL
uniref:Glyco_hydro_19_cat domain-containing protein n=1 Tax=Rhabditophanes sp. KR3021 TaxID=114890 RepID=A0AC35U242_9BILA